MTEYMDYALILGVIALASYIQAISGFAFGVIIMGIISGLGLMAVTNTAILISLLSMVNTATALSKGFANVRWREVRISLLFSLPSIGIGLYFLHFLSASHIDTLHLILGAVIFFFGVLMLKRPHQDAKISSQVSFAGFGLFTGILTGMFSIGGALMVVQFYRQPLSLLVIRDSLFTIFFIGSAARIVFVVIDTGIELRLLVLSSIAIPVVVLFTKIGQRFALKLSETTVRRAVFGLLTITALTLVVR